MQTVWFQAFIWANRERKHLAVGRAHGTDLGSNRAHPSFMIASKLPLFSMVETPITEPTLGSGKSKYRAKYVTYFA